MEDACIWLFLRAWLLAPTAVVTIFGTRSSRGTSPCSVAGKDEVRKTEQVGAATLVLFSDADFCCTGTGLDRCGLFRPPLLEGPVFGKTAACFSSSSFSYPSSISIYFGVTAALIAFFF